MPITETQMDYLKKKYEGLIFKISHKISGDPAISDFEDNVQDLWIAAMAAVTGFARQKDGANGKPEDFIGTKGFDKYLKTCLWNGKNNKGATIQKKKKIRSAVSIGTGEEDFDSHNRDYLFSVEDPTCIVSDYAIFLEEFSDRLSVEEKDLISAITDDAANILPCGKINVRKLSRDIGKTAYSIRKLLSSLSRKLKNQL